jgi:hypothetical protein
MSPIQWSSTRYTGEIGRVNGIELFTISWNMSAPRGSASWVMRSTLPGAKREGWEADTVAKLHAKAEAVRTAFISKIS